MRKNDNGWWWVYVEDATDWNEGDSCKQWCSPTGHATETWVCIFIAVIIYNDVNVRSDGRLAYQRLPPAEFVIHWIMHILISSYWPMVSHFSANVVTDRISLYIVNYLSSKNILSQILNYIYATNSQIKGKLTLIYSCWSFVHLYMLWFKGLWWKNWLLCRKMLANLWRKMFPSI